jgi:hypothetical protein
MPLPSVRLQYCTTKYFKRGLANSHLFCLKTRPRLVIRLGPSLLKGLLIAGTRSYQIYSSLPKHTHTQNYPILFIFIFQILPFNIYHLQ